MELFWNFMDEHEQNKTTSSLQFQSIHPSSQESIIRA